MRVEFPRISKAVEVEEPSVLPFSELTVGSTVDSVLVTPQEKGNIRCVPSSPLSTIIATRRLHLCDICITFSVYIVYCLVLYTTPLSSHSLTALGFVVLVQQCVPIRCKSVPSSSVVPAGG